MIYFFNNKKLNKLLILCFISILSLLFCWGCTRTINANIDKIGDLPTPLVEPLPLTVGVYYGNDFRNYKVTQTEKNVETTFIYNVQLGKANIDLFDYILSSLFKKVIPVSYLPNGYEDIGNVDLIIEPTVVYYSPWFRIELLYAIKFYLPTGKKISLRFEGKSEGVLLTTNNVIKHTQLAMRDFAAQFIVGFCKNEELKEFFYNQCCR